MNRLLFLMIALSACAGCFIVHEHPADKKSNGDDDSEEVTPDQAACGGTASQLPAAVDAMLSARCQGCHGDDTKTPVKLMTYDDLVASDPDDDTRTVADLVLERIQDADNPMPPSKDGVTVPQEEIDAFSKWIDDGKQKAEAPACDDDGTGDDDVAVTCTSGKHWVLSGAGTQHHGDEDEEEDEDGDDGTEKGPRMNPGKACISCHGDEGDDEPIVRIGGTVYPTAHEEDLCWGAGPDQARVVLIDANDQEMELAVTDTGNFSVSGENHDLVFPIRAKVIVGDDVREMQTPQDSGDCNSCHTQDGDHGAPGRIFLP